MPRRVNDGRGPGILKSTDGGSTWGPAAAGIENTFVTSVAFDPASPAIVYAVAMSKVYQSRDGAATWSQLTGYDLPFVAPARIVIDPAGVLYAGSSIQSRRSRIEAVCRRKAPCRPAGRS